MRSPFRCSISSVSSLIIAPFGSCWLTSGFIMFFALWAYSSVLNVSSGFIDVGETVAIIDVPCCSPRDSWRILLRFSVSPSTRAVITLSPVRTDYLVFPASQALLSTAPNQSVFTSCKINQFYLPSSNKLLSICSGFFHMDGNWKQSRINWNMHSCK